MSRRVPQLVIALDTGSSQRALELVEQLLPQTPWFKVGLELYTAVGPSVIAEIVRRKGNVFLDLKFHDIPNTVARAVSQAVRMDVGLLDLHLSGGAEMVRRAVSARDDACRTDDRPPPKLLGVTVPTSLGKEDLRKLGIERSPEEQVLALTALGLEAGMEGVVASPREIRSLRKRFGQDLLIATPGIRPEGSPCHDQVRTLTPEEAANEGADYLVVGRPVTEAADPPLAARSILDRLARRG